MHQLRKTILQTLYEKDARSPLKAIACEDLAEKMRTSWEEIQLEVAYLEEKGYLILKNRQIRTRIFSTLYITAKGIDAIEKEETDEIRLLRGQLTQRHSNLQYLEEQAAMYGVGQIPLHLHNQIDLEYQAIDELTTRLNELEGK